MLIWAGDAGKTPTFRPCTRSPMHGSRSLRLSLDWVCNTAGVQAVVSRLKFAQSANFNSKCLEPYTVSGVQYGVFKTAGNLSFLNVFKAGHGVSAYQPVLSLQAFMQTLGRRPLCST